jgi:two-component system nitrogen regulation response regulator NtrX
MRNNRSELIGVSPAIVELREEIERLARSDAKVLISGESGSGKEVVARVIHTASRRASRAFVAVNCAGLPETLLESELFGHVRGSFTGAYRDKAGKLELADSGTVFLDEVGEMTLRMQGMLLRFLETGEVQRVGCERPNRRVNVRIIAATNRDLAQRIGSGAFREDLYYRLNVIRIHVAPLRDRQEDVPELFDFFAQMFARQYGVGVRRLSTEAERLLAAYPWPGNVRELKNLAERLAVTGGGEPVRAEHLPTEYLLSAARTNFGAHAGAGASAGPHLAGTMLQRLLHEGESFWTVVHAPFMDRDISRDQLRRVVSAGLEQTRGNYRLLVELFNMPSTDYKRFLGFLRKHDCQVPFHSFRTVNGRSMPGAASMERPQAAAV